MGKIIALIILLIVLLVIFMLLVITLAVFKNSYGRFSVDPDVTEYLYDHFRDRYPRREVFFPSDGETLKGYVFGEENEKALIVFSHGIWSGHEQYLSFLTYFIDKGYRVFAYDYRGYNGSTGEDARGLPESPVDLKSALDYVRSDNSIIKKKDGTDLKILTMGHSWGAYASTAVLNLDDGVFAACAMSGFDDPVTISVETGKMMLGPVAGLMGPFINLVNGVMFGKNKRLIAHEGINKSNIPVLLTHADRDAFIALNVSSIVCHKDEITNPNVKYHIITENPRDNHNDFFLTAEAAAETQKIRAEFEEISKKYKKGEVPRDLRHEFFSKVDKVKANQPCTEYYELIDAFFTEALIKGNA